VNVVYLSESRLTNFAFLEQREGSARPASASSSTDTVDVGREHPRHVVRHDTVDVADVDTT